MSELQRAAAPPNRGDSLPETPIEPAAIQDQAELHHSYNLWRALIFASLCCICCPKGIKSDTGIYLHPISFHIFQWMVHGEAQEDDGSSGTGTGSGTGSGGTGPQSLGGTTYATTAGTHNLQRGGDKDPDPDPERRGDKSHRGTSTASTRPNLGQFLCPFFFHGRLGVNCDCKFNRIGDVRQHIWRRHRQPMHCPVCGETFVAERDATAHINQQSCTEVAFDLAGVTRDQWGDICERAQAAPHTVNGGDVERWFAIWDILFPGEPRPPSPYVDISIFLMRFRDELQRFFDERRGWDVIFEEIPAGTPYVLPGYRQGLHNVLGRLAGRLIVFVADEERPDDDNRPPPR